MTDCFALTAAGGGNPALTHNDAAGASRGRRCAARTAAAAASAIGSDGARAPRALGADS